MTNFKNTIVTMLTQVWGIISLIFAALSAFAVTRFDNLGPGMLTLFNKEVSREEKKNILSYTIKNWIVFGLASFACNEMLNLSSTQKMVFNAFFCVIGLSVFIFVLATVKEKRTIKSFLKEFVSVMNISLRIGFLTKAIMVAIALIYAIPVVGPLSLGIFVVVNLPKTLKDTFKQLF